MKGRIHVHVKTHNARDETGSTAQRGIRVTNRGIKRDINDNTYWLPSHQLGILADARGSVDTPNQAHQNLLVDTVLESRIAPDSPEEIFKPLVGLSGRQYIVVCYIFISQRA